MPPRAAETPQNHLTRGAHRRQKNEKCQKRRAPSKPRRGDRPQAGVQPLTKGAAEYQVDRQMSFPAEDDCRSQRRPNVVPSGGKYQLNERTNIVSTRGQSSIPASPGGATDHRQVVKPARAQPLYSSRPINPSPEGAAEHQAKRQSLSKLNYE